MLMLLRIARSAAIEGGADELIARPFHLFRQKWPFVKKQAIFFAVIGRGLIVKPVGKAYSPVQTKMLTQPFTQQLLIRHPLCRRHRNVGTPYI